jgi:hypothetical protein
MLIHFVRNGPSYLPELEAYAAFIASQGHQANIHDTSATVPNDAQVVWWICGRVSHLEQLRLKRAFHIHEYSSSSVPPHAWLKDQVKRITQAQPDYRVFQNPWVRERMGFSSRVPSCLRDMGIAPAFFEPPAYAVAQEFDLVYLGEMTRLQPFLPVLQSIHQAGRSLLLVGDVPEYIQSQLPPNVTVSGRVSHADVPTQLRRARFGLNLVSNIAPYNQQTSTKLLEYCAVGLSVVSNDYPWVRYFASRHQGNFHLLSDNPDTWLPSFGEALEAYPYQVPDLHDMQWSKLLAKMPLWKILFGNG